MSLQKRMQIQADMQEEIRSKANINIVTCGDCGYVLLHYCGDEMIRCPHCHFHSEPCDFPDLFY